MQRRGLGRLLYGTALPGLRAAGFHSALAAIALPNERSVALHEAMGFAHAGTFDEVGRKLDRWWSVGWWQRAL
jgi:phosphinothricin acetyltransferase